MLSVYVSMSNFEKNILEIYGDRANKWLSQLPDLVTHLAREWGLSHLLVVQDLSYNFVMAGNQRDKKIILKFGLDQDAISQEAAALRAFDGYGCVKLLDYNQEYNALLIEHVEPGHSLKSMFPNNEENSIDIACQVMKRLHNAPVPPSGQCRRLEDWFLALSETWHLPAHHLKKSSIQVKYLLETAPQSVLLHGDLHHDNILAHGDHGWLAIDPKGIVGDPGYEASVFIYNPITSLSDHPQAKDIMAARIKRFSEQLNYPEQRLRDWCYVQAVLSACWFLEDNLSPKKMLHLIDIIDQL
jgi:streptomycin 6-kinase